ncbi:heterokaryon incompatibility protein-domain-containing protein [Paraphoma chrysanthemicola]|nr:heterokaryon incompatibility protein-domain-containing protein [Paraphoma chrysanthemicola]
MRLLQLKDNYEVPFVNFIGDEIPPYAILSHTWGPNDSEVSYEDIVGGVGKNKAGYKKIVSCGRLALTNKLEYFWVDTCAIDKSSSAELSEAINSMYRWYRNARICFAYLEDVRPGQDISTWSTTTVRWFSRGWTLQELVASPNLQFFASDWTLLGSKSSYCEQLASITGIHAQALIDKPIESFSIAQRMSWASSRSTTRPEDIAYCLLGLFDVNMPLLYGEGAQKAFLRLQEGIMKDSDDQSLFA